MEGVTSLTYGMASFLTRVYWPACASAPTIACGAAMVHDSGTRHRHSLQLGSHDEHATPTQRSPPHRTDPRSDSALRGSVPCVNFIQHRSHAGSEDGRSGCRSSDHRQRWDPGSLAMIRTTGTLRLPARSATHAPAEVTAFRPRERDQGHVQTRLEQADGRLVTCRSWATLRHQARRNSHAVRELP
jgi:hypothetical protein